MKRDGARPAPGTSWPIELPGGKIMVFRYIPAGEFRIGERGIMVNEQPVHRVVIPDGFWLGETPVTQEQFALWKPEHENRAKGGDKRLHPAEKVRWDEARDFCRWLTETCAAQFPGTELIAGLPDEARWEYACRAGTETEYWSGDGEAALAEVGWYDDGNAGGSTMPVGDKPANRWGLHDMHGNVWEWCVDAWDDGAYRARTDGWQVSERRAESPNRVPRGGSWISLARRCRSAFRDGHEPSIRYSNFGFRVCLARSSPPASSGRTEAEPAPGGVARRRAEAEPDGAGGAGADGIDLANERMPRRG